MSKPHQNSFVTPEIESSLRQLISELKKKGHNIPESVEDISEFPYENFEELSKALKSRNAILLRFSFEYNGNVAQMLNPTPAWTINIVLSFLFPIISVILTIFYSWWCILGLSFFFIGQSRTKKLYNNTIFTAAMTNEMAFCFLFYLRQISVASADRSIQYYFDSDNSVTKSV